MRRIVRCSLDRRRWRLLALSLSLAAHKHANEDIPRVYIRGPVSGGQRLVSVSPTLRRVKKQSYPRPASLRRRLRRGEGKVRQPCCILAVSALHRRHVTESR